MDYQLHMQSRYNAETFKAERLLREDCGAEARNGTRIGKLSCPVLALGPTPSSQTLATYLENPPRNTEEEAHDGCGGNHTLKQCLAWAQSELQNASHALLNVSSDY